MRKLDKSDTRLSCSSATTLRGCEQKWVHYKVKNTESDPDYEEGDALAIGKAFHWIIEQTEHKKPKKIVPMLKACTENDDILLPKEYYPLIIGMVHSYTKYHAESGHIIIAIEELIEDPEFMGYIDAVVYDSKGYWWICDNKTFAYFSPSQVAQFASHIQMNVYAAHTAQIAKKYKLNLKKFRGCRLFVTTKPRTKRKKDETAKEMAERLKDLCATWDVEIPIKYMAPESHMDNHRRLHKRSIELRSGDVEPFRNYDYCMSYFRPCQYWSNCHGDTYSNGTKKIKVKGGV